MSVYVISDLHGCFQEFRAMLEKIEFSEYDEMIIAGDVCDRGPEPIPLLRFIMEHENIHLIFGNHDEWLAKYTSHLIEGKKDPSHLFFLGLDFVTWRDFNGGYVTMDQFMDCELPVCYSIQNYLETREYYREISVGGRRFLIIHAGLGKYAKAGVRVEEVPVNELIWSHIGINDNPFSDRTMIVGHKPTFLYGSRYEGKIIHGKNLLHIDCGCVFGRTLGCVRLDDMKEFYVKSTCPYVS